MLSRAADYDAVVIAGDALSIAAPVPVEAQVVAIRATLEELARRTRVFLCSGNHDLDALNDAGEKTARWVAALDLDQTVVDGQTAMVDGTLFTVLPWWDGPVARAAVDQLLKESSGQRAGRWVWVYHSPPEGPLSWTGSRHYGDEAVRAWIELYSPDVVLCGHIHQAPFTPDGSWVQRLGTTYLFNPGKQTGNVPACVEVDLGDSVAVWMSAMGVEEQALELGQ